MYEFSNIHYQKHGHGFGAVRANLDGMTQLGKLETSDLEKPTPLGPLGGTIAFLATHEAYHIGQLAMLRRALGMPGKIG